MSIATIIRAAGDLGKSRIEALSDGVFSIAMTLLVLDVSVLAPSAVAAAGGLARALLALWPRFLTYALSFGLLGVSWVLSPAASLLIFVIVPLRYRIPERAGRLLSPPASGPEAR